MYYIFYFVLVILVCQDADCLLGNYFVFVCLFQLTFISSNIFFWF